MRVIATAGHVDHGKSALVQVLSGINPDRLIEEQERGLTIDLGFAWMELPLSNEETARNHDSGTDTPAEDQLRPEDVQQIGIVDVPGHIDFIKNMLAGVGSVDAVLLVVAADEGVMPQTREHLAILDLLAVPTGVVALSKVDLVHDPEWLDLVEFDLRDKLAGTRLADAPIVRVSAHEGTGIGELRKILSRALVSLPPRRNRNRPRLPIDRIFSLSGFGTIVTGTLSDGTFRVGDAVEILPDGPEGRIRSLQTYKQPVEAAVPGSRVAMNLSGVGTDEISRGQVVSKPDTLRSTRLVDVSFRLLPDAPKALVHNMRVDFFSGAAEIAAYTRLLGAQELIPGEEGWLQLRLREPVVVAAGDHYILRQPSPSMTLGGGVVLNPHPQGRHRRFDDGVLEQLQTLEDGAADEILLQVAERFPLLDRNQLIGRSGLGVQVGETALAELLLTGAMVELDGGQLVVQASLQQLQERLLLLLGTFHSQNPLRKGMPRGEARSRLRQMMARDSQIDDLPVRAFNHLVKLISDQGVIEEDDSTIWLNEHRVEFTEHQQAAVDRTLSNYARSPFSPPNMGETMKLLDGDEDLLEALLEQNELVRLHGGVLLRTPDYEEMVTGVRRYIQVHGSITLAEARDLFNTSRKYAQALLEELDARRVTRREEDRRLLRANREDLPCK